VDKADASRSISGFEAGGCFTGCLTWDGIDLVLTLEMLRLVLE
jgi:hypothetical protein